MNPVRLIYDAAMFQSPRHRGHRHEAIATPNDITLVIRGFNPLFTGAIAMR